MGKRNYTKEKRTAIAAKATATKKANAALRAAALLAEQQEQEAEAPVEPANGRGPPPPNPPSLSVTPTPSTIVDPIPQNRFENFLDMADRATQPTHMPTYNPEAQRIPSLEEFDDGLSPLTPPILNHSRVAQIEDPLARQNFRYLEGMINEKKTLEDKLGSSLTFPGINRTALKAIALCEFVDFNKMTTQSILFTDTNANSLEFDNGQIAITQKLKPVVITNYAEFQHALTLWADATIMFYPHRRRELYDYMKKILELHRVYKGSITRVMEFDVECRRRVSQNRSITFYADLVSLQQQLFSTPGSWEHTPSSTTPAKPKSSSTPREIATPRKNPAEEICENFQKGLCKITPCPHGRIHQFRCKTCLKIGHRDCSQGAPAASG